ncbi:inorganic pyrophosphatase-like [Ischnura elegans]|uniref:inorganic pyrophosphatase-like n=1 Tax=Ischnura elegans TaxID=197161 RepID=UPI001ED89E6B|nr:inorganic pyrophosphatase-like [Ischnura elegans]
MIVEIPRWTNYKMEISLEEPLNPIKQDDCEGKLRYLPNCFPYHGIPWNYGAIPQTLEDSMVLDEVTGFKGDGDPVDVIEIGQRVPSCGEVLQVKVLGALGLIDRNKIDWKLIAISTDDEHYSFLKSLDDVNRHFPGILNVTTEWFDIFKVAVGKPENYFYFNGEIQGPVVAHQVIKSAHEHWKKIIARDGIIGVSTVNVSHVGSPNNVSISQAQGILNASPELGNPLLKDSKVDMWYFKDQTSCRL